MHVRDKTLRSKVGRANHENRRRVHCKRTIVEAVSITHKEREHELTYIGGIVGNELVDLGQHLFRYPRLIVVCKIFPNVAIEEINVVEIDSKLVIAYHFALQSERNWAFGKMSAKIEITFGHAFPQKIMCPCGSKRNQSVANRIEAINLNGRGEIIQMLQELCALRIAVGEKRLIGGRIKYYVILESGSLMYEHYLLVLAQ